MDNRVRLLGTYGGDLTHAGSAWVIPVSELSAKRRARIGALLKDALIGKDDPDHGPNHTTPFEKSFIHFMATTDIATHIHILKHRIGVSVNAESARYKELKDNKFYLPIDWPDDLKERLQKDIEFVNSEYHEFVVELEARGFTRSRAKESARFIRPYASQITQDIAFNFLSFMHFQTLRNDKRAQIEVREIAAEMLRLVRETHDFDLSLEAFGYGK